MQFELVPKILILSFNYAVIYDEIECNLLKNLRESHPIMILFFMSLLHGEFIENKCSY